MTATYSSRESDAHIDDTLQLSFNQPPTCEWVHLSRLRTSLEHVS